MKQFSNLVNPKKILLYGRIYHIYQRKGIKNYQIIIKFLCGGKRMARKIIRNRDKGILFFITGLSGSGKTSIAKKIHKEISQLYGPTLEISGNNFRKIF